MKHTFRSAGRFYEIEISPTADGYLVRYLGVETPAVVRALGDGALEITLDGRTVVVHAAADGRRRWAATDGRTYELQVESGRRMAGSGGGEGSGGVLRAPMPGQVREVRVAEGDRVAAGQVVLLLEAMKMEIRIQSPVDGVVKSLPVITGEQVDKDQVLAEVR